MSDSCKKHVDKPVRTSNAIWEVRRQSKVVSPIRELNHIMIKKRATAAKAKLGRDLNRFGAHG